MDLDNDVSQNSSDNDMRDRDRDRRSRGQRPSRFSDADSKDRNSTRDRSCERRSCRIYVSNIPYDYKWQHLKDLFRRMVGRVEYVELFNDENGKARGCGIIEFKDPSHVQKALDKMNRHELNGREIVVKEDHGEERDQYGRIVRDGGRGGAASNNNDRTDRRRMDHHDDRPNRLHNLGSGGNSFGSGNNNDYDMFNTYGLSASFLENLGINGPLHNKIFVANLDYKVDKKKLKIIFKLAGKVQNVELSTDKEGNSRGFAVIEYEHPVEAVQAISMFDRQNLYDRRMTVRLDRIPEKNESLKLPEGLSGIGMGLGPNGEPLKNVARNLASMQQPQQQAPSAPPPSQNAMIPTNMNSLQPTLPAVAAANLLNAPSVATAAAPNMLQGLSGSDLAALTNVLGNVKNLTALSQNAGLLSSGLNSMGMTADDLNKVAPSLSMGAANNYNNAGGNNFGTTGGNNFGTAGVNSFSSAANNYNTSGYNTVMQSNNQQRQDSQDFSALYGDRQQQQNSAIGSGRKSDTIVIKNIPLSCTWQTLRDKFRDIGEVKFAEIRGNDVGVVRFFKENDAELAIKLMDGSRIDGRTVNVNFF